MMSGGGTCNVLESDTSYEAKKENHGAPMDIWRLDFSVRNGSGRWLDHLIARFQIESAWPECTNWDGPDATARSRKNIEWADSIGNIQESGRNVVSPGQTLTETRFFIVLRGDPDPRFSNWSMDFNFAAAPPAAGAGSPAAATAAQQTPPAATAGAGEHVLAVDRGEHEPSRCSRRICRSFPMRCVPSAGGGSAGGAACVAGRFAHGGWTAGRRRGIGGIGNSRGR